MPIVHCDIREGFTQEQKNALGIGITEVIESALGVPRQYVFVSVRETDAEHFVEAGVVAPSYDSSTGGDA